MTNLVIQRLAELATNEKKPRTAIMVRCYFYSKATSILNRPPFSLEDAISAVKKNRETGYLSI